MIFKRSTLAREIFEEVSFEQVKMINLTIEILKRNGVGKILDKQRIDYTKKDIDLLKIIVNFIFWIKENECPNFRTREETERLIFEIYLSKILNKKIIFFALFCPSYKKGVDLCGFNREIGETTKRGIENLDRLSLKADSLGIKNRCLAVYSDLVLENCDKMTSSPH